MPNCRPSGMCHSLILSERVHWLLPTGWGVEQLTLPYRSHFNSTSPSQNHYCLTSPAYSSYSSLLFSYCFSSSYDQHFLNQLAALHLQPQKQQSCGGIEPSCTSRVVRSQSLPARELLFCSLGVHSIGLSVVESRNGLKASALN